MAKKVDQVAVLKDQVAQMRGELAAVNAALEDARTSVLNGQVEARANASGIAAAVDRLTERVDVHAAALKEITLRVAAQEDK